MIGLLFIGCTEGPKKINKVAQPAITQTAEQGKIAIVEKTITAQEFGNAIASYQNPITRDTIKFMSVNGKTTLPLKNGTKVFTDNKGVPYDEDMVSYNYRGQFKSINSYVVEVHLYEDSFFLLINNITGKQDTVNGYPHLSKDHQRIFSSQYNPYETYDSIPPPTQDVECYAVNANGIKLIDRKPFKFFISQAFWKDKNTIYIQTASDQEKADFSYRKLELTSSNHDAKKKR